MAVIDDCISSASSIAILRAANRGDKSLIQMSFSKIIREAPELVRPDDYDPSGKPYTTTSTDTRKTQAPADRGIITTAIVYTPLAKNTVRLKPTLPLMKGMLSPAATAPIP